MRKFWSITFIPINSRYLKKSIKFFIRAYDSSIYYLVINNIIVGFHINLVNIKSTCDTLQIHVIV